MAVRLPWVLLGVKADVYIASLSLPATTKAYASETKNLKTKLPNVMGVLPYPWQLKVEYCVP